MLLGTLTLGAGLGVGLGLSEGTATYAPTVASALHSCRSSPTHFGFQVTCSDGGVGYSSSITLWFAPRHGLSKKAAACVSAALDRAPRIRADFGQEMATVVRNCGFRGRL
jgi:hypothetical protein